MRSYLFIDQNLDTLRKEIETSRFQLFKNLVEQCERYRKEHLPVNHPPKSTTYIGIGIANLSLAYLLTKQEHYLLEAKRWIFTVVNYPHWGHAHLVDVDLSAAWILFGLSLAYDWLKDDLTEEEQTEIKEKLHLQATRMFTYKKETEGHGWSTNYWQNHNWINLTGLATCGYALKDDFKEATEWVEDAKDNFAYVYENMPADGSNYEGVVYWRYGAMWLFVYAHLLKTEEGTDYFRSSGFLKNTFYYRLYQATPNLEEIINYGDCHDRRSGHSAAVYYKVASEYNNGHAQYLANRVNNDFLYREQYESGVKPGILPEALFALLWYNPQVSARDFTDLPLTKHFEDLGLCVVRSSWAEDAIHFSFKSGHPGGKQQWKEAWKLKREKGYDSLSLSHQHADNNSFILNAYGSFLAVDEGYSRTVKASEHNVIIVDDTGYIGDGNNDVFKNVDESVVAEIEAFVSEKNLTAFVGEASKMYPAELELTRNARHVIYSNQGYFILLDELRSNLPHEYKWIMHADTAAKKLDSGVYEYENGLAKMQLVNLFPESTRDDFTNTYVRAVMTTQEPDNYRETLMKTIHLVSPKVNNTNYLNVLIPRRFTEQPKYQVEKINEGVLGTSVTGNDFKDVFLYSETNEINYQGISAKASWVLLQYKEDKLANIIVHNCESLHVDGNAIYEGAKTTKVISI